MRRLMADPDDTSQVFRIIEALKGNSLKRALKRLRASSHGQALLDGKPDIVTRLNDREWLASLPAGSVGRAYHDFVHGENLSADGLIESSAEGARYEGLSGDEIWLADRLRDIHDLQHVMTGYGRDPVGELSLLSFMTTQTPNRGIDFIIWVAGLRYRKEAPQFDVGSLVREGAKIGQRARWMPEIDWETKLAEPLDAVRAEYGFEPPIHYRQLRDQAPEFVTGG